MNLQTYVANAKKANTKKENEVYTNPGWWTNWISAGAKMEKEPIIVLWSTESMEESLRKRIRDGEFRWNYARH